MLALELNWNAEDEILVGRIFGTVSRVRATATITEYVLEWRHQIVRGLMIDARDLIVEAPVGFWHEMSEAVFEVIDAAAPLAFIMPPGLSEDRISATLDVAATYGVSLAFFDDFDDGVRWIRERNPRQLEADRA